VLDVRLPGLSGLDLQHELARANIDIPIVFVTGYGDIPMSVRAMKAGAIEFLTKPFRDQDLLDAIQQALERDRSARQHRSSAAALRSRFETLTEREQQVLQLVVAGRLNKEIAAELGTAEITVKVQRGKVMRKMQADSVQTWSEWLRGSIYRGIGKPTGRISVSQTLALIVFQQSVGN
jgi:FixJ family two-component response regulator